MPNQKNELYNQITLAIRKLKQAEMEFQSFGYREHEHFLNPFSDENFHSSMHSNFDFISEPSYSNELIFDSWYPQILCLNPDFGKIDQNLKQCLGWLIQSTTNYSLDVSASEQQLSALEGDQVEGLKSSKEGYPTKNFLVNFKKSHFQFLKTQLGKKFTSHRFIQRLARKKGISMKQYQKIYSTREFKECLELYFKSRQIYRDMMTSKMDFRQKNIFLVKLDVFEEAFRTGVFDHIN